MCVYVGGEGGRGGRVAQSDFTGKGQGGRVVWRWDRTCWMISGCTLPDLLCLLLPGDLKCVATELI